MATKKIGSFGSHGLYVMQFPSGKYGYVGTVPEILTEVRIQKNNLPYNGSVVFDTESDAIQYFENVKHLIN